MGTVKVRHLVVKTGKAGPLYYWQPAAKLRREGWMPIRLPADERQAVAEAMALNAKLDASRAKAPRKPPAKPEGAPQVQPGTLAALIRSYKTSRFFVSKRERTKASYNQHMRVLEAWGGDMRVTAITPATVEVLYTSLAEATPRKAAAVIAMLRTLLQNGIRQGLIATNAASRAGIKGSPPSGRIWPRRAVALFVEAADAAGWHSIGTAVMLGHWLGQRETDILELPRAAAAGGRLVITQSKTGSRVSIPESPALRDRIAAELARQEERRQASIAEGATPLPAPTLLVCETTERPWTEGYFKHTFADVRAALAAAHPTIPHADGTPAETAKLQMRHLRHTAVTELAVAGCTPPQIAGVTGHSLQTVNTILSRYLVLTAELADTAAAKRTAYDAQKAAAAERT